MAALFLDNPAQFSEFCIGARRDRLRLPHQPHEARAVGIKARSTIVADVFFWITLGLAWLIDAIVRVFRPQFSITRMITRVVGYHLMSEFLMSQTRPLRLPGTLNAQMLETIQAWSDDPRAASWINRIEDKLTTRGVWGGGTQS